MFLLVPNSSVSQREKMRWYGSRDMKKACMVFMLVLGSLLCLADLIFHLKLKLLLQRPRRRPDRLFFVT